MAANEVRLLTNGRGADFALEATARPELGVARCHDPNGTGQVE